MKKVLTIGMAVLFTISFATGSFAATAKEIGSGMGKKLTRGVVNAWTGWIELLKEMYTTGKENPLLGVTVAPIKGSAKTVVRTTAGGVEAGTFLFPVPKHYEEPLIEPETVFSGEGAR